MESASKANKQEEWKELLSRVQDLARATSDENTQLINKVKALEFEVTLWKQALSPEKSGENSPMGQRVALCVIDGTRSFFSTNYTAEGEEGGRKAGQEIIGGIGGYLADTLQDTVKISIAIYITKARLRSDLAASNICAPDQFDKFIVGLDETPNLIIVEVGSKKSADKKIEEHLQLFAGLPQTVRVFFSGGNGSEYLTITPTLESCTAKDKLVILRSFNSLSNGASARIPSLMLAGLFMKNIPVAPATPFYDPSPFPLAEADELDARTPSPRTFTLPRRQTVIDPSLPLYKQNPPPCNEYYLMQSCSKEGRCRYSHEYDLTDEQLATLSVSAQQSPCWFLNNNRECPYGMTCCWGHVCPFGVKCHYSFRDKCRFKGEGMHRPRGDLA